MSRRAREWYAEPVRPLSLGARKLRRALLGSIQNAESQEKLALNVGCTQTQISRFASGERTPKSYRVVIALERELGIAGHEWEVFPENMPAGLEAPTRALTMKASNER